MSRARNAAEHYIPDVPEATIQEILAKAMLLVQDIMTKHLNLDPMQELGQEAWLDLVTGAEVYQAERERCVEALRKIPWATEALSYAAEETNCTHCSADLIMPLDPAAEYEDLKFQCRGCGTTTPLNSFAQEALQLYFGAEIYRAATQGSDDPLIICPNCLADAYVITNSPHVSPP